MGPDIARQVDINLLDGQRRGMTPLPRPGAVLAVLAALAVVLLVPVVWLLRDVLGSTTALSQRLTVAQSMLKQLAITPPELVALRSELDAVQKSVSKLDADLTAISSRRIAWGTALSALWNEAGANVNIQAVQTDLRRLTVKGDAASLDVLSAYVDRVRLTGYFSTVIIELVTSPGTPMPLPTSAPPPAPSVVLPTPVPTVRVPTPVWPTATAVPYPPTAVVIPTPLPTWTPQPTYTPLPTYTQPPPPPPPSYTPPRTATPIVAVRIRDIVFYPTVVTAGGTLRVEVTIDNLGNVPLIPQDNPPPGYTYQEGQTSPAGQPGLWRIGVDRSTFAGINAHRYRWGFGGVLQPGGSRRVIGYIRLNTPGVYMYCFGVVQEFVGWRASCEGATMITVGSPTPTRTVTAPVSPSPSPSRTPTVCADGYEPDNNYQQSRVIGANSSLAQQHNFDVAGDADWVKFAVIPGITYTLRTLDLHGGADTMITLYGKDITGTLHPLAQNDEDPANVTPPTPVVVGPSRIVYTFTTTETTRFGTTMYARINSPNPGNFGCSKTYSLRLTSGPTSQSPGLHLARALARDADHAWLEASEPLDVMHNGPREAAQAAQAPRVGFTIILELRGGGP